MEPRFGRDLGGVRVHTDDLAARSARTIGALAYTVGRDIAFASGRYEPGSEPGKRLLAHELAHVIQQSDPRAPRPARLQREDAPDSGVPVEPPQYNYSPDLNPELQRRFNKMVIALNEKGIKNSGMTDVRPVLKAHKASTAHHIHTKGAVPLSRLQSLKGGQDVDGNTWYKKEWETVDPWFGEPRPATSEEIMVAAKENAFEVAKSLGSGFVSGSNVSCAYEGYPAGDPRRAPNVDEVPVSAHVSGDAIDLTIDWAKLGGEWSEEANAFVASFGLTRPFTPASNTYCIAERWHFELGSAPPEPEPDPKPEPPKIEPPKKEQKTGSTNTTAALRDGRSTATQTLADLPLGTRVVIVDDSRAWILVDVDASQPGLVLSESGKRRLAVTGGLRGYVSQELLDK